MDIYYIKSFLLGFIQGVTEFLPISSSGHLILFQNILHFEQDALFFDILLHIGTLGAIALIYKNDITALFKNRKMCLYLILGTIPAVVIGFTLHDHIEALFAHNKYIGIAYFFTAFLLYLGHRAINRTPSGTSVSSAATALLIGLAQAVAIIPGISRSGATIVAALLLGVERKEAAKFSFLLSIPAILGAVTLESLKITKVTLPFPVMLVGIFSSLIFGYLAIKLLLTILTKGKLSIFSYYCAALGVIILIFFA